MDTTLGSLMILLKGTRMNQRRYTEEVLKPHFVPFYNKIRRKHKKEVVMQKDRAKYHFAPILTAYKDSHKVQRLDWPPQSPDLSLIENLWKRLKDRISARRHKIRNIEEIKIALQQEWAKLEEEILNELMKSMPKKINEILKNKGGSAKY
jgi:transposase